MSAFIGNVRGPHHNSPNEAAEVWCSPGRVELTLHVSTQPPSLELNSVSRTLDPVAARNLAALLIRASQEAEWVAAAEARLPDGDG